MKKRLLGTILAAICMITSVTGCETTSYSTEEPQYIPADKVFVFDEDEITVKKLFDGAMETVRYAKYLKLTGEYDYSYSVDIGVSVADTRKRISSKGPAECEIYHDDEGNSSSVVKGDVTYDESMYSSSMSGIDYETHKRADYTYNKAGDESFIYYGDGDICGPIDIEQILLFDISDKNIEEVKKRGDYYTVVVTGDLSGMKSVVSDNFEGKRLVSEIIYDFDCKSHELAGIKLYGSKSRTQESNGITISRESESFSMDFSVAEVSFKDAKFPDIPNSAAANGYINDVLFNDAQISVKEEIDNPFLIQNEFYSVASAVWSDTMALPESDRNTVAGLKEALRSSAEAYDIDEVSSEYALYEPDYRDDVLDGALIRFRLSSGGEDQGYIIVPLISGSDGLQPGSTMSLDIKDYAKFNNSGSMQFVHDFTPSCQYRVQYKLTEGGDLKKQYEEIREAKMSNLSDQAEVVNFPQDDWDSLKRMAQEVDDAAFNGISRYEVGQIEKREWIVESYYVTDSDLGLEDISAMEEAYGLDFQPSSFISSRLKKLGYSSKENAISWVQIPGE